MLSWTPDTRAKDAVALEILLHGPLPRIELARRLDLSAASLTRLTKPLLDSGLVVESATDGELRAGRPTRPLEVVATAHHFVGVKLTGDDAYAVLTTLRAEVLRSEQVQLTGRDPASVVSVLANLVGRVVGDTPRVAGLGVSIGGLTRDRGVVKAPFLDWREPVPLAEMLERATGLPTVLDNDVLAVTRAEHWFGPARDRAHFAVVTIGAGVGCGLVIHDKLIDSADAGLGLVGHHPLDPLGPLCFAGHRGCATAMLTIGSIETRVSTGLRRQVGYEECLDLALDGDPVAVAVATEGGRALGRLIAAVANFTLARTIILTGDGVRLASVAAEALHEGVLLDRDPDAEPLEILTHQTDFDEWARGAAATAIQAFVLADFRFTNSLSNGSSR